MVGCALYDPQLKFGKIQTPLKNDTAELVVILKMLQYFQEVNPMSEKLCILSDSGSALDSIRNLGIKSGSNYIAGQIVNNLETMKREMKRRFISVRGHSGIKNNEMVDSLQRVAQKRVVC